MIAFDEIDDRLKALGKNRLWLAEASGRSEGSIRAALAPNSVAKNRSELLQKALTDAIELEEAKQRKGPELPDRISLEVNSAEFEAYNEASLAEGLTLKAWAVEALNRAAIRSKLGEAAEKTVAFPTPAATSSRGAEEPRIPAPRRVVAAGFVDMRGGIAAGSPISGHVVEEPVPVAEEYPQDWYALRVFGESMEPDIPDGSLILVKPFRDQGYPRKGTVVVYSDASGSTLKVFDRRAPKGDEEHVSLGKVPVLVSINPDFPEVQTMEEGRIDAVFVKVLEEA